MSSEKQSENLCRRKPKISGTRFVLSWLGGPKPRPRGVGDGQTVDIPSPVRHVFASASVGQPTFYWMEDVIYNQGMTRGLSPKWWNLNGPEKLANWLYRPYRKPTQVGEESILRRVRELQLRNSANYYCNLGIR